MFELDNMHFTYDYHQQSKDNKSKIWCLGVHPENQIDISLFWLCNIDPFNWVKLNQKYQEYESNQIEYCPEKWQ